MSYVEQKETPKEIMEKNDFLHHLQKHIPEGSSELIWPLISDFNFSLKVTNERITKHGDYRLPHYGKDPHKITVNGSLNVYAFLLTFLHEVAHMHAYELYGKRIKPHGVQWKRAFVNIAKPFLENHIWPADVEIVLRSYFKNPKASSGADPELVRVLHKYDENQELRVEDIAEGALFLLATSRERWFRKGVKRRTRYLCKDINTGKSFTIHGLAKVKSKNE